MNLPFKKGGTPRPWPSRSPEPERPHEDIGRDHRLKLFRGLLFAMPVSLLLWWGIYALVRAWL